MSSRRAIAGVLTVASVLAAAPASAATLAIQTRPAVAGVRFSLDGATAVSDAAGRAALPVGRWQDLASRIAVDGRHLGPSRRARLVRWAGNLSSPQLAKRVRAVLELSAPVTLRFVDPHGRVVPPGRISVVRLAGSQGAVVTLYRRDLRRPVWLPVTRVRTFDGGNRLTLRPVTYAVRNVVVDGASVVHRGQQRLTGGGRSPLTIRLLFYSVHLTVQDALLARRIGSRVTLTGPGGVVREATLAPGQALDLHGLPRGGYAVRVDARGLSVRTSFTLSRDTQVPLRVVSDLDLAIFMLGGGLLLLALTAARRALRARAASGAAEAEGDDGGEVPA
jgi:hypothetical protein